MKSFSLKMNHGKIRKIGWFIALYTIAFCIVALTLDRIFSAEGKTFVWSMDGMAQHVVALKYIRDYLITFFTTGSAPMVDYSLGQGFDVIGTLNYYGFGDPLTLLTVLFPESAIEIMYEFLIFFRMYLSGIFVAYLCKTLGKTNVSSVLPASLLYAFCNYALCGGLRHPLFFNGIMYLPLLIAGVEILIKKKKIGLLCISVALAFASNYYFMYMNTIMAAIYFFVRQFGSYRQNGIKNFFMSVGRVVISYLWGIGMAAVILFPAVYAFLNNARATTSLAAPDLFYSTGHYNILINSFFISYRTLNNWSVPGIGVLGMFAVAVLIASHKKSDRKLLAGFVIVLAMLCFPFVGKVMNGFSYATMRFSYAMALLLSVMLVYAIDNLREMKKYPIIIMSGIIVFMSVYLGYISTTSKKPSVFCMALILIVISLIIALLYYFFKNKRKTEWIIYGFTVIAVINLMFNCTTIFSSRYFDYCSSFYTRGKVLKNMKSDTVKLLQEIDDDTFYRTEREREIRNRSAFFGFYGDTFYYSIVPGKMTDLYSSVGLSNFHRPFVLESLEGRQGMMSLASVKYYADYEDKNAPYGFEKIKEKTVNGEKICLYENKNFLPLGVTYTSYMTRKQYDSLKLAQREQALLTSAVVDEDIKGIENNTEVKGITISKPEIREKEHVKIKNDKIKSKRGGKIKLKFKSGANSQTLLALDNVYANDKDKDAHSATFKGKRGRGKMRIRGKLTGSYFPKPGSVLNLGYSFEPQTSCKLKFWKKRKYQFDDLYVASVSMDEYENCIRNLKRNTLTDIKVGTNVITGKLKADRDEILQFSLPYSKGYSVYVDNRKVHTFSSSIGYMGVKVKEGNHDIKVKYASPGIIPGIMITLISCILFGTRGIIIMRGKSLKIKKRI